jgi:hypothetical protein
VEEANHGFDLMHVLKDPFAILLEKINSPNVLEILRFKFIYNFLNGLSMNWIRNKHVQRRQVVGKMLAWMHWHFDFT